jgi:hypothetical protein
LIAASSFTSARADVAIAIKVAITPMNPFRNAALRFIVAPGISIVDRWWNYVKPIAVATRLQLQTPPMLEAKRAIS